MYCVMEFHPKKLPISKTFDLKDEQQAQSAADEMVRLGFKTQKAGFKVLMPKKESKIAKRIGYTLTTAVTYKLREKNQSTDIKYWTYHHDDEHYAIVLIDRDTLDQLGF